jgi:hypothetical protein
VSSIVGLSGAISGVGNIAACGPSSIANQNITPGGRLTLTSGVSVTTSDVTGATTVYYAPAGNPWVPIYDGTTMCLYQFTASATDAVGLSVALGANWTTNTNYDWFIGLNSAVVTLCSGPSWNAGAVAGSDTARGTGAGSTELQSYNGVLTNKNSMTCRYGNASTFTCAANQCTYVGSFRTTLAGTAEDSVLKRYVSNAYNQAERPVAVHEAAASWSYSTAAYRQANNSAANQVSILFGLTGALANVTVIGGVSNSTATFRGFGVGIGIGSTTVDSSSANFTSSAGAQAQTATAIYRGYPGLGLRTLVWLERAAGADTQTWYGVSAGLFNTGMTGTIFN